ncbi:lamina-associated polypeptide 2, isoforms beta/gamma-like [Daphnia pulex]|uniref:lamina-associated polypeptide 2, isoforms beta/gamma-like n=1 Tax=Daphnia pulex TaxID=6669 RepID=UPI001EDCD16E|nr:lamina-associated polypeptide 2, isoforms beta/gamma-like [Daphnia pulex]XP_046642450.1 lamina-associated polypeptide 2, isoforms beta/gamma-like [Daphnia pulicaria]
MASLTKEQLKNELISHGVQPPIQSARKEEFVKLYEQHVAPIVALKGDFSSDEETDVIEEKVEVPNTSLVFNGLDITTISDDDLYNQLQSFGIPVGPIVDTTRSVYQRKLAALLQNGTGTPPAEDVNEVEKTNGNGASQEEKYSDSEEEEQQEQVEEEHHVETVAETYIQPSTPAPLPLATDPVIPEPLTAIRKRIAERPPSSMNALPLVDRQGTPTPRPSIRSFTGSSQYTYESRRLVDATDGVEAVKPLSSHVGSSPVQPKIIHYVLLLILFTAIAYFLYTYSIFDQFKHLPENVRRAIFQYLEKAEQVAEKIDNAKPNPMPDV